MLKSGLKWLQCVSCKHVYLLVLFMQFCVLLYSVYESVNFVLKYECRDMKLTQRQDMSIWGLTCIASMENETMKQLMYSKIK